LINEFVLTIATMIPNSDRYYLKNAYIPTCLIDGLNFSVKTQTREGLSLVNLEINAGSIAAIDNPNNTSIDLPEFVPTVDLQKKIILPCFIDLHTHLDKEQIWQRTPNPDGTFESALTAVRNDYQFWSAKDLYRRMEFGIKCSYAHGTSCFRTHIDSFDPQAELSFKILQQLQQQWQDKITIQAVSLVSLDYYQTPQGVKLADRIQAIGGILGGVAYTNPDLETQLDTVFSLARARNLDLDFHADENGDIDSICLLKIAEAAIRNQFTGNIICGHCCSLAVQPPAIVEKTIELVKQAKIAVVSLPMCNLYLQDRKENRTPKWRGITLVRELKEAGISVTFASDNCRDPFYGFGDRDVLEVFKQAVRIAHLDTPYSDWIGSVTKTPANLMGLPKNGIIGVEVPADFVIFQARNFSELLSRSQHDRLVIRQGRSIDTTLPDYSELDDLLDSITTLQEN
jgi:cytosine/creatinine deaminase